MRDAFRSDGEIERIGEGLIARTLPKVQWTHAAHFAAAVWLLARRPDVVPERDMPDLIRAYNEATGVANTGTGGYHETITLASLRAARAFVAGSSAGSALCEIVNRLLASDLGDPRWLLAYWSEARLFSVQARRSWVDPDLRPLPF